MKRVKVSCRCTVHVIGRVRYAIDRGLEGISRVLGDLEGLSIYLVCEAARRSSGLCFVLVVFGADLSIEASSRV